MYEAIAMFKILIVVVFLAVVGVLFSGLFFLVKDRSDSTRVVKALAWRVGLAAFLIVLVAIGIATGMLQPHGIGG